MIPAEFDYVAPDTLELMQRFQKRQPQPSPL